MIGLRHPRVEHRERGCSSTVEMQCAIFSATRHWAILQGPAGVVNASRRPLEATTTGHAPKYRKFTAGGLLQGFSAGKGDFTPGNSQTSDFFGVTSALSDGKCRTFILRIPMFGRSQRPFSLHFASFGGRFPADMAPKRLNPYFQNRKDWHTDMAKRQKSPFFLRWNRCRTLSEFLKVFGVFNLTFPLH